MAGQRIPSALWTLVLGCAALTFGIFLIGAAWWNRPLPRDQLLRIEQIGPIYADMPLVRYGGIGHRQNSGTYRTQDIRLLSGGRFSGTYRPAKTLWVRDLDRVSRSQKLLFLVDPHQRLIYEATTDGKPLLAYEETAEKLTSATWKALLFGLGSFAVGAFWVAPLLWKRRREAQQGPRSN